MLPMLLLDQLILSLLTHDLLAYIEQLPTVIGPTSPQTYMIEQFVSVPSKVTKFNLDNFAHYFSNVTYAIGNILLREPFDFHFKKNFLKLDFYDIPACSPS